jgi:predicted TIM-barrel fold metal-dependent hydrolase
VRRIFDIHSHAIPSFLRDSLTAANRSAALGSFPEWTPELALRTMDEFGVERTLLSVSTPGVHFGDDSAARTLARRYNEYCASLRDTTGGRFGAFAALPALDIEGACEEAAFALDVLKFEGVGLLANYETEFLGNPVFEPLMRELDARRAVVFVHPAAHSSSRALPLEYPLWVLEYPIDTTRAAVNLIISGTTRKYPNIRYILAHNGGALPFLTWRVASVPLIDRRYSHLSAADIRGEIRKFYFDIAQSPGDEALGSLLQIADPSHILFGSDWPYCSAEVFANVVETFESAQTVSNNDRAAIFHTNAKTFFD